MRLHCCNADSECANSLNRTLVIQTENGKWYVHPFPASCPNLSDGLNDEPDSTRDFTEVYSIEH
jgi:hypothetical protein